MAKYRCVKDCFFDNRFHYEGREYDFGPNVVVPKHFAAVGTKEAKEVQAKAEAEQASLKAQPTTMHDIAKSQGKVAEPPKPKKPAAAAPAESVKE